MGDVIQLGLAGAVVAGLVAVLGYLIAGNRADREQYQGVINNLRSQRDKDEARYAARVEVLEAEADSERKLRIAAEKLQAAAEIRAQTAEYRAALHQPPEGGGT